MNELTISLDPHRKTPLYEQIYGFIREEIRGGRIRAGERLPSARALSGYLSVSRSTVDLAYEQLVSEGYLESVPCKGYFVCEIEGLYRLDEKKEETKEDDAAEQTPFRYDFAVTGTAPGGFPQNSWKKISKEVLLDADDSLFQLGDAKGEHGLREAIRDYLHHARGVNCRTVPTAVLRSSAMRCVRFRWTKRACGRRSWKKAGRIWRTSCRRTSSRWAWSCR